MEIHAQNTGNLNQALVSNTFNQYYFNEAPKRKILSFKNKKLLAKINPINYLSAGMLFFYQRILSEQIQAACMYEISCSNYTKAAIEKHGLIKGSLIGLNQLNGCFPAIIYDFPDHKVNKNYKVINRLEDLEEYDKTLEGTSK